MPDIINKLAAFYEKALTNEFPQYRITLDESGLSGFTPRPPPGPVPSAPPINPARYKSSLVGKPGGGFLSAGFIWAPYAPPGFINSEVIILVWKDEPEHVNGELILRAAFSSSHITITCWKDSKMSIDIIHYADPRFTEDILSSRLAAYDADVDTFMAADTAEMMETRRTPHD